MSNYVQSQIDLAERAADAGAPNWIARSLALGKGFNAAAAYASANGAPARAVTAIQKASVGGHPRMTRMRSTARLSHLSCRASGRSPHSPRPIMPTCFSASRPMSRL